MNKRVAFDVVNLGEYAQSFKSSPRFEKFDMVILNIDEGAFVSSPYVKIDTDAWESSELGQCNGKYVFLYDPESESWMHESTAVSLEDYGITVAYNVASAGAKEGDTITVNRLGEESTENNPTPDIQIDIDLTRSGKTLEANCPLCKPSNRQHIADNLLATLSGYSYQPYYATGATVNPLAELGDGISVRGIYGGMYQQELTFDQLMISDIGAPYEEELESEFSYTGYQERSYKRKFADIAADFEIHWNEITARVSKEGTGDGFSWSLIETGFSVKAGNKVIFRVDKNGTYTDGTGVFSGEIVGGSISIGSNFSVDENGYMECHGAEFHGDIYAQNGYFNGTVRAGNIDYGSDAGYFNGAGLLGGTVGTYRLSDGVNTSLGYANYANNVFKGAIRASYGRFTWVDADGGFTFKGYDVRWTSITDANGTTHYALTRDSS